mmetsp:Transcript_29720/g.63176  ORF Transcript_29720/g.63176 Transcript_29720/m.63176 type:complete len:91 (-) Transcript_29720:130-402(-)
MLAVDVLMAVLLVLGVVVVLVLIVLVVILAVVNNIVALVAVAAVLLVAVVEVVPGPIHVEETSYGGDLEQLGEGEVQAGRFKVEEDAKSC